MLAEPRATIAGGGARFLADADAEQRAHFAALTVAGDHLDGQITMEAIRCHYLELSGHRVEDHPGWQLLAIGLHGCQHHACLRIGMHEGVVGDREAARRPRISVLVAHAAVDC
ncbi:hypothetical protein D3C80_1596650 [compost metagenome]